MISEDAQSADKLITLLTDRAGNGPASKKKLKSQKKKKRKRYEEEEDEEELPAVKDVHSDAEDRVDHVGIELQQKQPKTEQTGRRWTQAEPLGCYVMAY